MVLVGLMVLFVRLLDGFGWFNGPVPYAFRRSFWLA